jgi:hypothetical protein
VKILWTAFAWMILFGTLGFYASLWVPRKNMLVVGIITGVGFGAIGGVVASTVDSLLAKRLTRPNTKRPDKSVGPTTFSGRRGTPAPPG